MRKTTTVLLIFFIVAYALLFGMVACAAQAPGVPILSVSNTSQDAPEVLFSPGQLDNLVAPVALYPDPLLAQVVVAATFPEQIDEAARFLRAGASSRAIDEQPWDVSVKAVAHYPTVLDMMADNLDWTTSLGQAYVEQSTDVMTAVQRLRARARAAGSLVTTPQMEVVMENSYIALWPAYPRTLYVPVYDPALVFYPHPGYTVGPVISFSLGFAVGSWLIYDCDWHRHHVYYHGWTSRRGWVHRYRPHVHINSVYVHNRHAHVRTNRSVTHRRVSYHTLNRYNAVHRNVHYDNVRRHRSHVDRPHLTRERGAPGERRDGYHPNKVMRRNSDRNAPRINTHRGRQFEQWPSQPGPQRDVRPTPRQGPTEPRIEQRPSQPRPQRDVRPAPRQRQIEPRVVRPPSQPPHPQIQRRENSVLPGSRSGIEPRAARPRGQSSQRQRPQTRPAIELSPAQQPPTPSRR